MPSPTASRRILDPLERASEILFGVIMVLTFTGSISVAESGHAETRTVLAAAVACNLAWGIVDAAMYLMTNFFERARGRALFRAVREGSPADSHQVIRDGLPPPIARVVTDSDLESLRQRLREQDLPSGAVLTGADFAGAGGVFLLVFTSTFPILIPFFVVPDAGRALRISNAVALAMLFLTGWSVGRHAGRSGWWAGLLMVGLGVALIAITMALGG